MVVFFFFFFCFFVARKIQVPKTLSGRVSLSATPYWNWYHQLFTFQHCYNHTRATLDFTPFGARAEGGVWSTGETFSQWAGVCKIHWQGWAMHFFCLFVCLTTSLHSLGFRQWEIRFAFPSVDYVNIKTPSMHRRLSIATLSQLAFLGESDSNLSWEKSHWYNTGVKTFFFFLSWKASCDRVELPNLRCLFGVLVFP